ncbi:Cytochrome c biogenesis protein Ccs1 [Oligella ureolytica]
MRFAVSLLTFIAIATIIGTVLEQNQTEISYIDKFQTVRLFVFSKFDVAEIYNTWWFLLIMGFLVVSTTVCLIRNTPMIKEAHLPYYLCLIGICSVLLQWGLIER